MKLTTKLLLAFVLTAIIPVIVFYSVNYRHTKQALKNEMLNNLTFVAEAQEGFIYSFLDAIKNRAIDFSSDGFLRKCVEEMRKLDANDVRYTRLRKALTAHLRLSKKPLDKNICGICIVDLNDKIITSTDRHNVDRDISMSEYFKQGPRGVCVSDVYPSFCCATTKYSYQISVAAPLMDKRTKTIYAVIVNDYNSNVLNKILSGQQQLNLGAISGLLGRGETLDTYLVNREKLLITPSKYSNEVMKQRVETFPVVEAAAGRETSGIYKNYLDMEVIGASMYFPSNGWTLCVEMSTKEVFISLVAMRNRIIILSIPTVLLAIFLAYIFSKRTHGVLRESEERFKAFMDNNPAVTFMKDERGRFIYINATYMRIFKTTMENYIGKTDFDLWPVEVAKQLRENDKAVLSANKAIQTYEKVPTPDGILRDWLVFKFPVKDRSGSRYLGGVAIDVTEQKRAEEKVITLSQVVEQSPTSIMITDTNGGIEYVNKKFTAVTEYAIDEVIGKNPRILKSGETPVEEYKRLWDTIMSGGVWRGEFHNKKKSGEFYWEYAVISPVRDTEGNIASFIGIKEDISERKQAERRLSAQHTVTQILAEAASIAEASPRIFQTICECLEWDIGELWAVDSESNVLRLVESWHLPSVKAPEFEAMSREITFSPGVGLPGRVWASGKPFWITDVTKDANFPRMPVAVKEGLHGAICFPIMVRGEILGVMDFFSCKTRQPDNDMLSMMAAIGRQIGLFVKRKQSDEISKRLSHQNELILNSAGEGIYGLDRKGCATFINPSASKMLGWEVNELIGKFMHTIAHHSKPDGMPYPPEECPIFASLETGSVQRVDNEVFWRKDGTSFPVRYTSTPIVEEDKVIGAVVMFDDITERKRTELEYKTILSTAMDGFWFTDTEGRLLDVNDASCRLSGYSREELLAMSIQDIEDKETQEVTAQHIKKIMETGYDRFETRHRCKDGKIVDVEVSVNYVKIAGGRFFVFLRDITERKKSDTQIRLQLQRLAVVSNIDKAILSTLDLRVVLEAFMDRAFPQLYVDAADILLFNPYMQTLEYAVGRGFHTSAVQRTRVRLSEGCCGRAAVEHRPVFIHNLREESCVRSKQLPEESFVSHYVTPLVAKGQVNGVLEVFHRAPLDPDQEWLGFLETLAGQAAIAIDNAGLFEGLQHANTELVQAYDATIEGWSHALDLRDKETEGHSRRVTEMAMLMAAGMGVSKSDLIHVRRGALLHDIGKMGVPDNILFKVEPLTDEEWIIMRKHPVYAYELLSRIAYLRPALDIPYCHHEKWDGAGYPRGLKGEEIPLSARIFAVVDVWDAMRSDRPYRKGWADEKVREHIKSLVGTHFDPKVVKVFLKMKW
ncbi:MAG: PAS domain S-box protein [Planctomycetota bacterium]|nr:PAS domain S-box protein [Planctomycetota bacterium]